MKRLVYLLIIAAAAIGGYFLYRKMTEKPASDGGKNTGNGVLGSVGQQNVYSGVGIGAGSGSQTGTNSVAGAAGSSNSGKNYTLRLCSAQERQTLEFLQRELSSNREMAAHFENMERLIQEMPLCGTGTANVLGCVDNEQERQKMLQSARRERSQFEGLASKNEQTLARMKSQCRP
jgi:hypothetical protein